MVRRAAAAGMALLAFGAAAPADQKARKAELVETEAEGRATATAVALISKRLAANETRIAALRARVSALGRTRQAQLAQLAAQQAEVLRLLAVLQNLSRRPSMMLLAQPGTAEDAARVGAMLDTLVPQLGLRTAALRAQIERTAATRRQLTAEQARLDAAQASLALDRRRLEEAGKALAARAQSLRDLLGGLSAGEAPAGPRLTLLRPAAGRLLAGFGAENELGLPSQGQRWRTDVGAEVAAPADGRIAFTGPFRTYGRIVIIDHGDHILSLLAGLEAADVAAGETVRAGQRVGRMGGEDPVLYFEVRSGGEPVDPRPWLAGGRKSSQG